MTTYLWLLQPLIYTIFAFYVYSNEAYMKTIIPKCLKISDKFLSGLQQSRKVSRPTLIKLIGLDTLRLVNNVDDVQILSEASKLAGFEFESIQQFSEFILQEQTNEIKFNNFIDISRFCNVTTIIGIFAIIGMSVTFIPAMGQLFGPIAKQFAYVVYQIALLLAPFAEQIGYIFVTFILSQTVHVNKFIGYFIGLFSLCIYYSLVSCSAIVYSTYAYITFTMWALPTAILAMYYQSSSMGFFTVVLSYLVLIMYIDTQYPSIFSRMEGERVLNATMLASMVFTPLYYYLSPKFDALKSFKYGAYVFGPIMYFFSILMLIESCDVNLDVYMILSLIATLYCSAKLKNEPTYNVALTFVALYMYLKILKYMKNDNFSLIVFLSFFGLYLVSMYLKANPKFMQNMITHST